MGENKKDFLCCIHSKNHIRKKRTSTKRLVEKAKIEKESIHCQLGEYDQQISNTTCKKNNSIKRKKIAKFLFIAVTMEN